MTLVKISKSQKSTHALEDWSLVAPVLTFLGMVCLCMLLVGIETGVSLVQQDKTPNLQYAEEVVND